MSSGHTLGAPSPPSANVRNTNIGRGETAPPFRHGRAHGHALRRSGSAKRGALSPPAYPPSSFTRRCFNGNCKVTFVPLPVLLSTAIWPPWARMIRCTTIMPRPCPVGFVVW